MNFVQIIVELTFFFSVSQEQGKLSVIDYFCIGAKCNET